MQLVALPAPIIAPGFGRVFLFTVVLRHVWSRWIAPRAGGAGQFGWLTPRAAEVLTRLPCMAAPATVRGKGRRRRRWSRYLRVVIRTDDRPPAPVPARSGLPGRGEAGRGQSRRRTGVRPRRSGA